MNCFEISWDGMTDRLRKLETNENDNGKIARYRNAVQSCHI